MDKKAKQYKGVFVAAKYATEVKNMINKKIAEEKEVKKTQFMGFAGMATGDIGEKTIQDIKAEKERR